MAQGTYTCATPIKGSLMRVVKLDVCGVPVTGAGALAWVSKGFVQVQMSPQYEDGEEFFERTADGSLCVNQKDPPVFKRHQLSIDFCSVDPQMAAFLASFRLLDDIAVPVTGTGWAMSEGIPANRYSLEVWQLVAGSGACDASGAQRYVYNAWPNASNTKLQDYTIVNGRSTLSLQSETSAAATQWARGPGTIKFLPNHATGGALTNVDHWAWNITTTTPPTPACGASALT